MHPGIQTPLQPGQTIARRYRVLKMIGRGGMGAIYRVLDMALNEEVALKTLLPHFVSDKLILERFFNEARIARQLSHPNIIRVHDIGMTGNIVYISMELLEGQSLRQILDKQPPGKRLPVLDVLRFMEQLCNALDYAHRYTIHRDIKPENVMITPEGQVKLMDFGISKLKSHSNLTATSMVMGTPQYMSPEQLRDSAHVDARSDIYSLGILLYEALTGEIPRGLSNPASKIRGDLPPALDPIVAKCLESKAENRYQSARELAQDIRKIRVMLEQNLTPPVAASPTKKSNMVKKAVGLALTAAVLVLALVAVHALLKSRASHRESPVQETQKPAQTQSPVQSPQNQEAPSSRKMESLAKNLAHKARQRLDRLKKKFMLPGQANAIADTSPGAFLKKWEDLYAQSEKALKLAKANRDRQELLNGISGMAALLLLPEDNSMVYIPPGRPVLPNRKGKPAIVPAFLADRYPVSIAEYIAFGKTHNWPVPVFPEDTDLAQPITDIPFYCAQACAAAAGKRIPSAEEWIRILTTMRRSKLAMSGGVLEWTRTPFMSQRPGYRKQEKETAAALPWFGVTMRIAPDLDHPVQEPLHMFFEQSDPRVGFRGVLEIPLSGAALQQLAGQAR